MGRVAKRFTKLLLTTAINELDAEPAKPQEEQSVSTSDAIAELKPAIKRMQDKGYTLAEILERLQKIGVDIGMTTLKSSVSKSRSKAKTVKVVDDKKPTTAKQRAPALQDPDEK